MVANKSVAGPVLAQQLRVLVIDDCKDQTGTLSMLIGLWGHEVRVAHDGEEALKTARCYRPHVGVVDTALRSRMDGFDLAHQLQSVLGPDGALLICVSGYVAEADRRRSKEAGMAYHLAKPVDPEYLKTLLATERMRLVNAKQIAQQAVMEAETGLPIVANEIEVVTLR